MNITMKVFTLFSLVDSFAEVFAQGNFCFLLNGNSEEVEGIDPAHSTRMLFLYNTREIWFAESGREMTADTGRDNLDTMHDERGI